MIVELPPKIGCNSLKLEDKKRIVLIGANGSGKTRFGVWIEKKHMERCHRISAQKALTIPDQTLPTSMETAKNNFFYGGTNVDQNWLAQYGKMSQRWFNNPETSILNDFDKLLTLLYTEEFEISQKFRSSYEENMNPKKPKTKLDIIKEVWEELLPHRKLIIKPGKIEVYPTNQANSFYHSSQMSDGERLILYMLGEITCIRENAIIIIDEPEMYLNKSILNHLWNKIESLRNDCTFIYLTHDIDFALSRNYDELIWIKSYEGNDVWDYQHIENVEGVLEDLYYELLGSRKPILFIEGTKSSYDYYIYQHLFSDYTVIPIDSCSKVCEATKSFNSLNHLHHLEAKGIIDRDRKDQKELDNLKNDNIYSPDIAEIENLFLIEETVKIVARSQRKDPNQVFETTKQNLFDLFKGNINGQALMYTKYYIHNIIEQGMNSKCTTFAEFQTNFEKLYTDNENQKIYEEVKRKFIKILEDKDYNELLKVLNYKGALAESKVSTTCGMMKNGYVDLLKELIKENSAVGEEMRSGMRKYIQLLNIID